MLKIRDIFQSDKKFEGVLRNFDVSAKIQKAWVQVMGGPLSKVLFFGSYQSSKLIVVTNNPAWVNEIKFHKQQILKNLENLLGNGVVQDVVVRFESRFSDQNKKEPRKNSMNVVSFEDKIMGEIKRKVSLGQHLCSTCQDTYSSYKVCVFCRSRELGKD